MVVLTNEALPYEHPKLTMRCWTCKAHRWRSEFPHVYARRCLVCTKGAEKGRCRSCGGKAPLNTRGLPKRYCDKPECQSAARENSIKASVKARVERAQAAKTHLCVPCGRRKPRTEEFFAVQKRDENGNIVKLQAWCRECTRAEHRARYASDAELRNKIRERDRRRRALERERCAADPEYAARQRARKAGLARKRYWERKRQVDRKESQAQPNSGPDILAWPLMDAIEAFIAREGGIDEDAAAYRLGTSARRFNDWRRPGAKTRLAVVDRCLLGLELNWWEVYPPVWFPDVAKIWEG